MRKKLIIVAIVTAVAISFTSCSSNENKNEIKNEVTNPPPKVLITDAINKEVNNSTDTISYSVLGEYQLFRQSKGYGAQILIDKSTGKADIIKLVKKISEGKDPVAIDIFNDQKAYEEFKTLKHTDVFKSGYIASFTKNKTLDKEAFYGENNIVWMQETGSLSSLKGTITSLD